MTSDQPFIARHSWKRLDGVDVLRGLAILFVLMNHVQIRLLLANIAFTDALPEQLVSSLFWNGQRGVQIFFVISGFLITSTSLRRWGSLSQVSVRDFYRLRFARIGPLLFLLLTVLSGLHFAHVDHFVVAQKTGGLGGALLAALTFHVNVLEARRGYLPANWDILWSLSVEEMFYLFFPWVSRLLGYGKPLILILCAFVLLGPVGRTFLDHGSEVWHEYSYLGSMDAIALGCLTALLVSRMRFSSTALWMIGSIGITVVSVCLCFSLMLDRWGLGRNGLDMSMLAVGTCMVVATAALKQWQAPRVLIPLLKLGQFSYEVYLSHMFVVFFLFGLFSYIGSPARGVAPLFGLVILIAGVLGAGIAKFYSEPMNKLLRCQVS